MNTRSSVVSAVASVGVLVVGWQAGAAYLNRDAAVGTPTTATTDTATPSASPRRTVTTQPSTPQPSTPQPSASQSTSVSSKGGRGMTATLAIPGVSGTFTGTTVTHEFGSVAVTVTLAKGKITNLTEQVVDDGERKSIAINQRSIPVLRSQILAASSGSQISTISGATYTTKAYLTSLQAALDKAR